MASFLACLFSDILRLLVPLWLPFGSFWAFWMYFGFHFGSLLAHFCFKFAYLFLTLFLHRFSIDFGNQVGEPRRSNESACGSLGLSWRSFWANMAPRPLQDRFLIDFGWIFQCLLSQFFSSVLGRCFVSFGPKNQHINQQRLKQTSQEKSNKTNQQIDKPTNP